MYVASLLNRNILRTYSERINKYVALTEELECKQNMRTLEKLASISVSYIGVPALKIGLSL